MVKGLLKFVFVILLVAIFIVGFIFKPIKVQGNSMYPTIKDGDWVLVNKVAYIFSRPQRSDIIVFDIKKHNKEYIIKRIIGLEKETIEIVSDNIYIDNKRLNESYVKSFSGDNFRKRLIPQKHYFVLGDNRRLSIDSRYEDIGFVNTKEIIGKIIYKW